MPLAPRKDAQAALPPQAAAPEVLVNTASAPTGTLPPLAASAAPVAGSKPKIKAIRAGFGQELTAYDQKIQRQIHRAGVWQAAVQCQAIVQYAPDFEAYKKLVRELANDGVTYTEE